MLSVSRMDPGIGTCLGEKDLPQDNNSSKGSRLRCVLFEEREQSGSSSWGAVFLAPATSTPDEVLSLLAAGAGGTGPLLSQRARAWSDNIR